MLTRQPGGGWRQAFGTPQPNMRRFAPFLVIAGLASGLLFWRYYLKQADHMQPRDSGVAGTAKHVGNPEIAKTVLIQAHGEGWTWQLNNAIRQRGTSALPSLITLITQRQDRVTVEWITACSGFEALGSEAVSAVPQLIAFLDDPRAGVRSVAATCLGLWDQGQAMQLHAWPPRSQTPTQKCKGQRLGHSALSTGTQTPQCQPWSPTSKDPGTARSAPGRNREQLLYHFYGVGRILRQRL